MKCFEALKCLVDKRMIGHDEQRKLLRDLGTQPTRSFVSKI
eukprot:CAMPEP_0167830322 /NCGR_PEP_ID=MMETSP0112_2-20121227/12858_2 /TAXON_ID=91324 /ORGANISM="Lotharella globosa, Strain CCCM811" /LENGTH=40 /DNA_ID= /DNA_START= /DNA_END= /DNA_ORIENTATION=